MVLSIVVLIVPIVIMVGIYRGLKRGDQPVTIDTATVLDDARRADDFPVAAPAGLPAQWHPISARYQRGDGRAVLRIGYVSPSRAGFQVVESDRPADALLAEELGNTRPDGTATVAGKQWQRYVGDANQRALVLLERERTVVVIGVGSDADLATLAGALAV